MSTTTSYNDTGTASSVDRDGKNSWNNPTNAQGSDGNRAICDVYKSTYGDWLRCVNFGFTDSDIPANAIIEGITVAVECQAETAGYISDSAVYLRTTSGQVGDDGSIATTWPTSDDTLEHGAVDDDWSLLGLMAGCAPQTSSPVPTPYPPEYLPTVIALTANAIVQVENDSATATSIASFPPELPTETPELSDLEVLDIG